MLMNSLFLDDFYEMKIVKNNFIYISFLFEIINHVILFQNLYQSIIALNLGDWSLFELNPRIYTLQNKILDILLFLSQIITYDYLKITIRKLTTDLILQFKRSTEKILLLKPYFKK